MTKDKIYFLGSDEKELIRLQRQHRIWAEQAHALWERAGFTVGQTILDLGCGPGMASMELSQIVSQSGNIISVDMASAYTDYLEKIVQSQGIKNIKVECADVEAMNLPESFFDGIYCRFFMLFIQDPSAVAQKIYKALKPGGVWAITDFAGYFPHMTLSPKKESFDRVVETFQNYFRKGGTNLYIQNEMPEHLASAGFEVKEVKPMIRTARPHQNLWQWPVIFYELFIPKLVEEGWLTKETEKQFWEDWRDVSNNPNAIFTTPPIVDIIAVNKKVNA